MPPFYQRPENALKRAEELIAVNQNASALELLHDVIMSKRSRTTPLTSLEPIMLKFIELSVLLRKGKVSKEGLHQYKNISQNVTISTIELVIKKFIELSEAKVTEAQQKADKINLDQVEDLEALETPESIILSTVSGEVSKDRTDREVVTPWLKFLWEAYRTALDILRNNARLEILYQSIANQAFKFCLKYERKTEFRRLCELLRQHVATAAKYSHQAHAINLNDPDTLQRHLDTRFDQLNAAAELELWQEAFRSVEDIHNLLCVSKKPPKPYMMANYYEKLARIFMVGENYLFHSAAWSKYYATVRLNKNLPEEEHQRMASIVLLSTLAIPIISNNRRSMYSENEEHKPRAARLTNLLRVSKPPNREILLKEALSRNVYSRVRPEVRELYNILEVDFHPLSICKKVAPILLTISETKELVKYIKPLQEVILTRLLQQLSQVYTTVSMDTVFSLATFSTLPATYSLDSHFIEKFIMNGCRRGELNIRINHMTKSITFETNIFGGAKGTISEGPKLQVLPSEHVKMHLTGLASRLHTAVNLINPRAVDEVKEKKLEVFKIALEKAEEERKLAFSRRLLIEKKKEIRENEAAKKAREEERQRALKLQQEAEEERKRLEEAQRQREKEQQEAQLAAMAIAQKQDIVKELSSLVKGKNLKTEDLENLDADELRAKQIEILEQERRELNQKTKNLARRVDHLERAFRKVELPIWEKDYDEQKRVDKAYYDALTQAQLEASATKHAEDLKVKKRLERITDDYQSYKTKLEKARDEKFQSQIAESQRLIEEAKAARLAEFRRLKQEALEKQEREEEERASREEADRLRQEELERERQQKEVELAKKKAEEEERLKKLAEQAEKQRERERLAEERIAAKRAALTTPETPETPTDNAWRPSRTTTEGGAWRPSRVAQAATTQPEAGPGVWRRKEAPEPARAPESRPEPRPQTPTTPQPQEEREDASWTTVNKSKYVPPAARSSGARPPPRGEDGAGAGGGGGVWRPRGAEGGFGGPRDRDQPRDDRFGGNRDDRGGNRDDRFNRSERDGDSRDWGRRGDAPDRDGGAGGWRGRDAGADRDGGAGGWGRSAPRAERGDGADGGAPPSGGAGVWRRGGDSAAGGASGGKYVPPSQRRQQ
ncbi:eukaryotic translation initiation factor 3 subunit A [Phlyctochytrium bullatum]|nr:eukaryotic translation initiation factor 3 subunit A [Phlyctochytrium bullatum]